MLMTQRKLMMPNVDVFDCKCDMCGDFVKKATNMIDEDNKLELIVCDNCREYAYIRVCNTDGYKKDE